jgi:hypothetical protein
LDRCFDQRAQRYRQNPSAWVVPAAEIYVLACQARQH